ncbi:MAG: putative ATPase [Elusimicrobia bacterium]|nr:MAG: putative ATPase [Elusimicrobiota bacterium]KAF0153794.1 MAG: putative ATPase [Elusimicrobiota bacterium]
MTTPKFKRPILKTIQSRLGERRRFIQVLSGPRQVGKTTLIRQFMAGTAMPHHYASADEPSLRDTSWIETQWEIGRLAAKKAKKNGALLILDEAHKVPNWSETVKRLWDEDAASGCGLKVALLGSSPLLIQKGLTESLAGRFELIRVPHWSFAEMKEAFGWNLNKYLYFGGYPGCAELIKDEERWRTYIQDSLVETTLSRDILLQTRVDKPALLRQLFRLACDYSGQILSYQKMAGQLQGHGHTVTLAHYLELLSGVGMVTGLQKYSGSRLRQRGSSPKLLVLNTGLMTSGAAHTFQTTRENHNMWGRLVESAVGAHLFSGLAGSGTELLYWRESSMEVDFVIKRHERLIAMEVTSSRRKDSIPGMNLFAKEFHPYKKLLVGGQGIPLEEFLSTPADHWF